MFSLIEAGDFHEKGWRDQEDYKQPTHLLFNASFSLSLDVNKIPTNVLIGNQQRLKESLEFLKTNAEEDCVVEYMQKLVDYTANKVGDIGE